MKNPTVSLLLLTLLTCTPLLGQQNRGSIKRIPPAGVPVPGGSARVLVPEERR